MEKIPLFNHLMSYQSFGRKRKSKEKIETKTSHKQTEPYDQFAQIYQAVKDNSKRFVVWKENGSDSVIQYYTINPFVLWLGVRTPIVSPAEKAIWIGNQINFQRLRIGVQFSYQWSRASGQLARKVKILWKWITQIVFFSPINSNELTRWSSQLTYYRLIVMQNKFDRVLNVKTPTGAV